MENLAAKLIDFLSDFSGFYAYTTILAVLLACGLGLPLPEDITLIAAGLLAGWGNISLTGALIVGFFGVLIGDSFLFFIGRKYGRRALTWPVFRAFLTPELVSQAEVRVRRNSQFICFIARFLPGLRAPIYLLSGVLGVSPWVFLLLDGFAALISVPVWVVGAYYFADSLDEALGYAKHMKFYVLSFVALAAIGYFSYKIWARSRQTPAKNT